MEKFSTWRDPSNGIAPFVLPVPTGDDASGPLLLVARLFQVIFAVIRFLLFIMMVGVFTLLDNILSLITQPWPTRSNQAGRILATLLLRPCLFVCFGFFMIEEEQAASRRRSAAVQKTQPAAGDLIISNWSSFIDVLYLTIKYSPDFLVPVVGSSGSSTRYVKYGTLGALATCGRVLQQSEATSSQTLDAIVKSARRPLVIFAEGTTSNNRAILKFITKGPVPSLPDKIRVFLTVLKQDTPSTFRSTVTCPIPANAGNPLPQIFFACTSPIILPRHLLVRIVASDTPSLSASNFWQQAAASMCAVGKLKQTNLGAEEKASFLEYYHSKSRSRTKEPVVARGKKRM